MVGPWSRADQPSGPPHATSGPAVPPQEGAVPGAPRPGTRMVAQVSSRLLRSGLAELMSTSETVESLELVTGWEDLLAVCRAARPDVVLLEITASQLEGASLAMSTIRRLSPGARTVAIASGQAAERAMPDLGAMGLSSHVSTRSPLGRLLEAVGLVPVPDKRRVPARRPPGWQPGQDLTLREREIVSYLRAGLTVSEMAKRLAISPKTIENHKQRLYIKLGVQSQTQAVLSAALADPGSWSDPGRDRPRPAGRLVIGDRNRLVRELIARACLARGLEVVAEVSTPAQVTAVTRACVPQVALVSDPLAGASASSTVEACARVGMGVVVMAERWSPESATSLLAAGAQGLVMYDTPCEDVAEAVLAVTAGGSVLDPRAARLVLSGWREAHDRGAGRGIELTKREQEVLQAMADGLNSKAIATVLGMATKTVEIHKGHIFDKLGARTQAHAVSIAMSQGLLPAPPLGGITHGGPLVADA